MIKQGKILEQTKDKVKIDIYPEGSCESCHLQGVCKPQSTGQNIMELQTKKTFKVGDEVEVAVSEGKGILFSFLLFIVPIIVIMTVYLIVAPFFKNDGISILLSAIGGVLYFVIIGQVENRLIQKTSIRKRS